jgi:hypothetical protein
MRLYIFPRRQRSTDAEQPHPSTGYSEGWKVSDNFPQLLLLVRAVQKDVQ